MYQMSLVGMWLTNTYGAMELEELCFDKDGTGWWFFANAVAQERRLFQWSLSEPNLLHLTFTEAKSSRADEEAGADVLLNVPHDYHIEMKTGHWVALGYKPDHPIMLIRTWLTGATIEFGFLQRTLRRMPTIEENPL